MQNHPQNGRGAISVKSCEIDFWPISHPCPQMTEALALQGLLITPRWIRTSNLRFRSLRNWIFSNPWKSGVFRHKPLIHSELQLA